SEARTQARPLPLQSPAALGRGPAPQRLRAARSFSSCRRQVLSEPPCCDPAGPSLSLVQHHTGTRAGQPASAATKQKPLASMLQAIRSKAGSFGVKGLFVLLILIFGIWGIGDIFRSRPTDTVIATVGDQSIQAEDLQTAMRRELE